MFKIRESAPENQLFRAINAANIVEIDFLLNDAHTDVMARNADSMTILEYLCKKEIFQNFKNEDVNRFIDLIIAHPTFEVNQSTAWSQMSQLYTLSANPYRHCSHVVEKLLHCKDIDVNKQTCQKYTPLHIALEQKNFAAARLLLAHPDTNVMLTNMEGYNALEFFTYRYGGGDDEYFRELVKLIMNHASFDYNPQEDDKTEDTMLYFICKLVTSQPTPDEHIKHDVRAEKGIYVLEKLLQNNSLKINFLAKHNMTPLMELVEDQQWDAAQLFLQHRTLDLSMRGRDGLNVFDIFSKLPKQVKSSFKAKKFLEQATKLSTEAPNRFKEEPPTAKVEEITIKKVKNKKKSQKQIERKKQKKLEKKTEKNNLELVDLASANLSQETSNEAKPEETEHLLIQNDTIIQQEQLVIEEKIAKNELADDFIELVEQNLERKELPEHEISMSTHQNKLKLVKSQSVFNLKKPEENKNSSKIIGDSFFRTSQKRLKKELSERNLCSSMFTPPTWFNHSFSALDSENFIRIMDARFSDSYLYFDSDSLLEQNIFTTDILDHMNQKFQNQKYLLRFSDDSIKKLDGTYTIKFNTPVGEMQSYKGSLFELKGLHATRRVGVILLPKLSNDTCYNLYLACIALDDLHKNHLKYNEKRIQKMLDRPFSIHWPSSKKNTATETQAISLEPIKDKVESAAKKLKKERSYNFLKNLLGYHESDIPKKSDSQHVSENEVMKMPKL
ncbi:MAG: ankyrin repeat domain-containing protein [Legionellales bacterium]|nr:ankyrin repeat domain-containing protein [Legionellales bacterium]